MEMAFPYASSLEQVVHSTFRHFWNRITKTSSERLWRITAAIPDIKQHNTLQSACFPCSFLWITSCQVLSRTFAILGQLSLWEDEGSHVTLPSPMKPPHLPLPPHVIAWDSYGSELWSCTRRTIDSYTIWETQSAFSDWKVIVLGKLTDMSASLCCSVIHCTGTKFTKWRLYLIYNIYKI